MTVQLKDQEYLWLKCASCGDRCKLAKNRGSHWSAYRSRGVYWIEQFLLQHSDCQLELEVSK